MEKRFRVTVIAKLRPGVTPQEVEGVVAPVLAEMGLSPGDTLRWLSIPSAGTLTRYVKFSALVEDHQLDDAWNLRASRRFSNAGYGDVAWKITPVAADDPAGEDTTWSVPLDLFQTWCGPEGEGQTAVRAAPGSFGSDLFWEWFADNEDNLAEDENGRGGPPAPETPGNPMSARGPARIICAACYRIRAANGDWISTAQLSGDDANDNCSHGICPDCARKLYPDLYPE